MDIRYFGTTPRYSEAVCAGGLIFLSGMVPKNGETAAEQTADVLAQTDRWLAECGSDKAHVLDAVIYLRDMGDYAEMNGVWDAWVAAGRTPARACVEARLARPEWRVEIKITAVKRDAATA
ncbi:TPA: RidA family protein [Neisseria gonorrhoeae]